MRSSFLSMIYYIALNFSGTISSLETWIRPAPHSHTHLSFQASDLLPSFLRCFPALRRATSAEDAVVGGGGGGVGGSKGATLVVNNCPFLLWYNICTRWIETRSCLLRSPPRSIDEPFALWRQRVNKSSKGGDQSRRWREGASDDIEL